MRNQKATTSVRVDEILFEKLKIIAEKNRRSLNSQMEMAFEQCINLYEKENGEIILEEQ